MKKKIKYGEYKYEYCLITQDRKTLSLTVCPDLQIIVKAPIDTSNDKIEEFFKKRWLWMEKQLDFFRQFQVSKTKKQYVSGESFLYLGRQYKLIVKKAKEDRVSLQQGRLHLYTTGKVREGIKNKKIIEQWYQQRTCYIFDERFEEMLKKFDYNDNPTISTRQMKKRWGSYTKNNKILLNPLLIHTSKKCIDYVMIHELCHVEHKKHNKDFYKLLSKKCKNWEKVKEDLELRFSKY